MEKACSIRGGISYIRINGKFTAFLQVRSILLLSYETARLCAFHLLPVTPRYAERIFERFTLFSIKWVHLITIYIIANCENKIEKCIYSWMVKNVDFKKWKNKRLKATQIHDKNNWDSVWAVNLIWLIYSLYQKFMQNERNFYNSPHVIVPLKTTEVEKINNFSLMLYLSSRMLSF